MNDSEFAEALKSHPCPECGLVGHLVPKHMTIRVEYKGQMIEAKGEGTVCCACEHVFFSDELTENMANQSQRIDGGIPRYIEVNRQSGEITGHTLN